MGKEVKYDWKLQEEWKRRGYEDLWLLILSFSRSLSCWLASQVSGRDGSYFHLTFSPLFLQWAGDLRPETNVFFPTPCHSTLLWLQRLQHFLASVGQRGQNPKGNLTHGHNLAACSRVCQWVARLSRVSDFHVLSSISDKAEGPALSVSLQDGGRILFWSSFLFLSPPPLPLLAQKTHNNTPFSKGAGSCLQPLEDPQSSESHESIPQTRVDWAGQVCQVAAGSVGHGSRGAHRAGATATAKQSSV